MLKEYVLEGSRIRSLDDFYDEVSKVVMPGVPWGRNLDALDDILSGGFGTPDEGFILRWRDSSISRQNLSYKQTLKELEFRLLRCHPSARDDIIQKINSATIECGPTAFDWLIEIFQRHGPNGENSESNVNLVLE